MSRVHSAEHLHVSDTNDLILCTKLLPPRPRVGLVQRTALLAQLDAGRDATLTTVIAPAGFGKTTLVGQWLRQQPEHVRRAWLSLDADDNDLVRFWRYLLSAFQSLHPDLGRTAMAQLNARPAQPFAPPPIATVLRLLLNDLAEWREPSMVVLEDYHSIEQPEIHESLAFVLEQLPANLRMVLIARNEPPLPLARLRARGDLCELNVVDLRFTPSEVAAFAELIFPFALPPDVLAHLSQRTEGWAVGLRLALLGLPRSATPDALPELLAGPSLVAYLTELLEDQPAHIQEFLLRTSILDRLTADLCDAVTGRTGSAVLLAHLSQLQLFLMPLDGTQGWYRYHALFAEAMRQIAQARLGQELLHECYRRASAWFAHHGLLHEAIEAALAAQDWEAAASLLERFLAPMHLIDLVDSHVLQRWFGQLPAAMLHPRPLLCLCACFVLLRTSTQPRSVLMPTVETLLGCAEKGWLAVRDEQRLGQLYGARALFALWFGQMDQAIVYARRALPLLPETETFWRGACLGFVGRAELDAGRLAVARQTLLEGLALSQSVDSGPAVRASKLMLADIAFRQADYHQAAALFSQVLKAALEDGDRSDEVPARLGLARLAEGQGTLTVRTAEQVVSSAQQLGEPMVLANSVWLLARVLARQGDAQAAARWVSETMALLAAQQVDQAQQVLAMAQAQLRLWLGDSAAVERWVATQPRLAEAALLVVRWRLRRGEEALALTELSALAQAAEEQEHWRNLAEIRVLMALALRQAQRASEAQAVLREALLCLQGAGERQLLLDVGEPMVGLLRATMPLLREPPLRRFAQGVLRDLVRKDEQAVGMAALSPQERRVLRLLVAGYTNAQIAEELVVSVNTVKTQLKQVFRKLGVTTRRDAVAQVLSFTDYAD